MNNEPREQPLEHQYEPVDTNEEWAVGNWTVP